MRRIRAKFVQSSLVGMLFGVVSVHGLEIDSVEPPSALPGNPVVIRGEGFAQPDRTTVVSFGAVEALVVSMTDTAMVAVVPEIPAGAQPITVQVGSDASDAFPFTVQAVPELSIAHGENDRVTLSWKKDAGDAQVDASVTLNDWRPVEETPTEIGDRYQLDLPIIGETQFFRLRTTNDDPNSALLLPKVTRVSQKIDAAAGGAVVSADNRIRLEIPPGALDADTPISITQFARSPGADGPMLGEIIFEPPGLEFNTPAVLRIHFDDRPRPVEELSLWHIGGTNPEIDFGSEISQFARLEIDHFSEEEKWVEVAIPHFSYLAYISEEPVYLVFDIQAEYLKKGDLIYALTGREPGDGAFWWPGHAGLYLGTTDAALSTNDGSTTIESTPIAPELGQNADGVQFSPLTRFKSLSGQHIYMGARRPLVDLEDADRETIAAAAIRRIGTSYATMGGPFITSGGLFGGISCVGLTEVAYEEAGISIVPGPLEPFLWPVRQFNLTVPVNEVDVPLGKSVGVFVSGVVKPPKGFSAVNPFAGDYFDNDEFTIVTMTTESGSSAEQAVIDGTAKFNESLRLFTFKPVEEDVGLKFTFDFEVDAGPVGLGKVRKPLFVNVVPDKSVYELTNVAVEGFDEEVIERWQDGQDYHWADVSLMDGNATVDYAPAPDFEGTKLFDGWNLSFAWNVPPKELRVGEEFTITMQGTGGKTAETPFGTHGIWGLFAELGERQPLLLESTTTREHNVGTFRPQLRDDEAWVAPVEETVGGVDRTWTLSWWENLEPNSFDLRIRFSFNESVSDVFSAGTIIYTYTLKGQ